MNEQYIKEKEYFDKNLNIGYVDETLPVPDDRLVLKHYLCSISIYGFMILLLQFNPFFLNNSSSISRAVIDIYYLLYVFIAPFIYFIFRPKSLYRSHNIEIANYIKRVIFHLPKIKNLNAEEIKKELEYFKPSYLEGQSLTLLFIKVFFGFLMIHWFVDDIKYFIKTFPYMKTLVTAFSASTLIQNREFLYHTFVTFLFTVDVGIFVLGYFTELTVLKNKIRTVETSLAGIFFCLICYPPFSFAAKAFMGWNQREQYTGSNEYIVWIMRFIGLFFIIIYVLASCALFTKGSNLTNRGIVSVFPYNIVRHPAYISKNLFWILNTVPIFFISGANFLKGILVVISFTLWAGIYYMRALTEERHLIKDPDYREYVKKVKYRFIPKII